MFDTRVRLDDAEDFDKSLNPTAAVDGIDNRKSLIKDRTNRKNRGNTAFSDDSCCDLDDDNTDSDTTDDESSNSSNGNGSDSDSSFGSTSICEKDVNTDDECDAGPERTRTFLYRHFAIIIVANETLGELNLVFMKATLLHTKGEDNNPRM